MTTENLEELRERMLRKENVQEMIRVRAYEIFQMRGGQPGGEAHDWFHAESEVLAFLIADESAREDDRAEAETVGSRESEASGAKPATKKPRTRSAAKPSNAKSTAAKKAATKRATSTKRTESKPKSKRTTKQSKTEESPR